MYRRKFIALLGTGSAAALMWACSPVAPSVNKGTTGPLPNPTGDPEALKVQRVTRFVVKVPIRLERPASAGGAGSSAGSGPVNGGGRSSYQEIRSLGAESDLAQFRRTRMVEIEIQGAPGQDPAKPVVLGGNPSLLIHFDIASAQPKAEELAAFEFVLEPVKDALNRHVLRVSDQISEQAWAGIRDRITHVAVIAPIDDGQQAGRVGR